MKIKLKLANMVKNASIEYEGKYKVVGKQLNVFIGKEEEIIEMEREFDFELEGKIYKTNKGVIYQDCQLWASNPEECRHFYSVKIIKKKGKIMKINKLIEVMNKMKICVPEDKELWRKISANAEKIEMENKIIDDILKLLKLLKN